MADKTAQDRYQAALAYLQAVSTDIRNKVAQKSSVALGGQISLGQGHGKLSLMSKSQRNGLRALMLCHLALNPHPLVTANLETIRKFYTRPGNRRHIDDAIRSFAARQNAGPQDLLRIALGAHRNEVPYFTTYRGDTGSDLGTCWNFVASCAFQAGLMSLQKTIKCFFNIGTGGHINPAKVLMGDCNANRSETTFNTIRPGYIVGFYRDNGHGGMLTHIAISTGGGNCIGVRQMTNPTGGVVTAPILAIRNAMQGQAATGQVLVRMNNPNQMERVAGQTDDASLWVAA